MPGSREEAFMKRLRGLLLLIVVVAGMCAGQTSAPQAQAKRAFGIEDLYRVKGIGDVHLSPDGTRIVYTVTTSDLARGKRNTHIWLMAADGSNPRQITQSASS